MDNFISDYARESGALIEFVKIVDDEPCPECGGGAEFNNRPKVFDEDGAWWRCYNALCEVDYYNPETGEYG